LSYAQFEGDGRMRRTQLNPGYSDVFLEPATSGVVFCYFKPLTIMCCRQQRPREAKTSCTFYGFRWRQQYQFLALGFLVKKIVLRRN